MWKYLFGEKKYIYYAHRYYPNIYVFIWGDIYTERERKKRVCVCIYLLICLLPRQLRKKASAEGSRLGDISCRAGKWLLSM